MSGLHSLATIIKRLEAATARLEDIAETVDKGNSGKAALRDLRPQALESPPPSQPLPSPPPTQQQNPVTVLAYDNNILNESLTPFVELTKSFASDSLISIVRLFEVQMQRTHDLLLLSTNCQKPSQEELLASVEPLNKGIEAMGNVKSGNKKERDWFTHLTFIAEAGPVVGWVLSPKPAPYISDVKEAVDYYGNKLIKEWKDKDPRHVDWVRSFGKILDELKKYVQEHHVTGLAWNPKGVSMQEYRKSQEIATAPPPPPPPPPAVPAAPGPPDSLTATSVAAVFAELNRGEDVTKGLRKVDKSEMTHKNPSLRAGSTVPAVSTPTSGRKPVKPTKPQALAGKKPAKFALEGSKWLVEYHDNAEPLTIDNVEISHVINIYACKNTIVMIKGKVNAVTLVNCTKTSVLVDSVVSSISVTRSPSFQLQVKGTVPMIQIDSTDSGQLYLSHDSLTTEITTAKCSAINVNLPVEGEEEGVFAEQAIPEMLKTVIKDGKLVTSIVEHAG
ncbi:hypothetical protein AX15_005027 [Amanita polypyramis BW_CC]|nr:hypothetical protein AX15_005027 [Amanita polypyramis BW_CC]